MLAAQAAGLDSETSNIAVVDVRDDDYIGGHIQGSLNFPSRSLDAMMPTLLRKLEGKETVVFHCALSQQRGPSAALRYLREREAVAGDADKDKEPQQTVCILDRGFVGWQEKYGPDQRLTEAYRKEIWEDY
ncbi:CDC25-like phosphatase YCH1 [Apiospora saccharicola]|uniref:CDC25-like phosphatase YCH1 n=1 Tax=Apiospora saccharicola TaxID=335842 RepID=A0ABR1UM91_9PEZI